MIEIDRWNILINMFSHMHAHHVCLKLVINWMYGLLCSLSLEWRSSVGACVRNGIPRSVHCCIDASSENAPHHCHWITACNRSDRSFGPRRKASFEQCKSYTSSVVFVSMTPVSPWPMRTHTQPNHAPFFLLTVQPNPIN